MLPHPTDTSTNHPAQTVIRDMEWFSKRVSATMDVAGDEYPIWIEASEEIFREPDFLLPVALLPAMKAGAPLKLPGEVSPRLLSSVPQIQDIFNMWESVYKHIPVEASGIREADAGRGSGVACFFSNGLDSFHTALRHRDELTHLIYLHLIAPDEATKEAGVQRARDTARDLGLSLIEVETNLRLLARDTRIEWKYYHGMWISSVALLFQHLFKKILIAGSATSNYDNLRPQGTHPILDPLWSTELTDFHHDGCEIRRVDKAAEISENPVAMKRLQVCDWTKGGHNCGVCVKCLRSMIALEAAGSLKRCETLPDEIDLEAVSNLDLTSYSESYFANENLRALKRNGSDPELIAALESALSKGAYVIAHSGYKEEQIQPIATQRDNWKKRAERLKKRAERLKEQNTRLVNNAEPSARHSDLRYRILDRVFNAVLKVPGSRKILRSAKRALLRRAGRNPGKEG